MIEFELKYRIEDCIRLPNDIVLIDRYDEVDQYYDTSDYRLFIEGNFLRLRNSEVLDFKIDIDDASHTVCKERTFKAQFFCEKQDDILKLLNNLNIKELNKQDNLVSFLDKNLKKYIEIKKNRSVYKISENILITYDDVEHLGKFLEVEMMLDDEKGPIDVMKTKKLLIEELEGRNIRISPGDEINIGYVEMLLIKKNPELYKKGRFLVK